MNLVSKLEALRRSDMVMRLAAFLLCLSLLLGLIAPKLEARAFAFAPPAVAAVAAAFLGACGLKVVVDGMDREGLQDAMYKLLKEFLDTELGGITIEEWLGSAWDMTVMLGKIFLGHSLADKLNIFAQWVAGKYATEVGSNIIYEGLDSYPNLISEGVNYPYSVTFSKTYVPSNSLVVFSLNVGSYVFFQPDSFNMPKGDYIYFSGFSNCPVASRTVVTDKGRFFYFEITEADVQSGKRRISASWRWAGDSIMVSAGTTVPIDLSCAYLAYSDVVPESFSIDRAPSMSYMPELEADQGIALDVGAAGTMDETTVITGVLDDVLAGELAPTMEAVKEGTENPPVEEVPDVENLGLPALGEALTSRFPFSIPWDIAKAIRLLAAPEKAPYFEVDFLAPLADNVGGWQGSTAIVLDFSQYAIIGQLSRWTSTIGFCLDLASGTKRLIWTA